MNKSLNVMWNINKENYFTDAWSSRFPKASAHFKDWVDKYKSLNFWDAVCQPNIKFHNLPFAMQFGILCGYISQFDNRYWFEYPGGSPLKVRVFLSELDEMFKNVEQSL